MKRPTNSADEFERARTPSKRGRYVLRLYVAGATRGSSSAIQSIRSICEERLAGRYELEIIDVYQQPHRAREDQIIALPTLIKSLPPPLRQLVGDLSNMERVLRGLDLKLEAKSDAKEALPRKARRR
jgi:circadian clock protein KaiB